VGLEKAPNKKSRRRWRQPFLIPSDSALNALRRPWVAPTTPAKEQTKGPLHGGEAVMLSNLIERLSGSGIAACAAIADIWGAAHALARYAARPVVIAPLGVGAAAIAALPLAALRLPVDMLASLHVLGFERIADLLAPPRAPLTLRFGPELGRRIDQALGQAAEPIDPIRPAG
jgi:protein ImuB